MVGKTTPRRYPVLGDIVVTKVADRYATARVQTDGTPWFSIQTVATQGAALTLACSLITGSQRVFLFTQDGMCRRMMIDCTNVY